ncbi:unnamed protein product [Fusarium graminearum]|nr:unnamed protein product [Fusarium graminearum]
MLRHFKRVVTAYLALTVTIQPSVAAPGAHPDTAQVLSQDALERSQASDSIKYGQCYKIKNKDGQDLGHLTAVPDWNYLGFGSNVKAAHFKVCQNLGHCKDPNRSGQELYTGARFWLFDVDGNAYSPRGEFVAANSLTFGSNKNMYPGGLGYRYYVNFWVDNDCSDSDNHATRRFNVKLHIDNLRVDKGLTIEGNALKVTTKDDSIIVSFQQVTCPDTKILQEQNYDL